MHRRIFLSASFAVSTFTHARQPFSLDPLIRFEPSGWDSTTFEQAKTASSDQCIIDLFNSTSLSAPPGADETAREIEFLLLMQDAPINSKLLADIERQNTDPISWMLSTALGDGEYKTERVLMDHARTAIEPYLLAAQLRFKRAHPSALNRRVRQLIIASGRPSYPSEYAAHGYLFGELLANLHPDMATKCRDAGVALGVGRETAGLHYRSDTVAGRTIAKAFLNQTNSSHR